MVRAYSYVRLSYGRVKANHGDEGLEKLGQLRALWNGVYMQMAAIASAPGHGIDTPADIEWVRELMVSAS